MGIHVSVCGVNACECIFLWRTEEGFGSPRVGDQPHRCHVGDGTELGPSEKAACSFSYKLPLQSLPANFQHDANHFRVQALYYLIWLRVPQQRLELRGWFPHMPDTHYCHWKKKKECHKNPMQSKKWEDATVMTEQLKAVWAEEMESPIWLRWVTPVGVKFTRSPLPTQQSTPFNEYLRKNTK